MQIFSPSCHPEAAQSLAPRATANEGPMHSGGQFFVYIMSNRSKTLYTGVTNNLLRRVWQHKQALGSEFCKQYKLDRLVYFERFDYVDNAIAREKQIKGWLRIKKIALIVAANPTWSDLSESWYAQRSWRQDA
jgi:putative endonuclease